MQNQTAPIPLLSEVAKNSQLLTYALYIVEGMILIPLNSLILGAILRQELLRQTKEYVLVAGLAFADLLIGISNFASGIYRFNVVASDRFYEKESKWSCVLSPAVIFYLPAIPMQVLMNLIVSFDRLLAVATPIEYLAYNSNYALKIIFSIVVFCVIFGVIGILLLINSTELTVTAVCVTAVVYPKYYITASYVVRIFASGSSVFIYILVIALYRRYTAKMTANSTGNNSNQLQIQLQRQKRLTVTVGISSLFTLFLYCIPTMFNFVSNYISPNAIVLLLGPYAWMTASLNASLNVILYAYRHKDIRLAMKYLILNKTMNPNMSVQDQNSSNPNNRRVLVRSDRGPATDHR